AFRLEYAADQPARSQLRLWLLESLCLRRCSIENRNRLSRFYNSSPPRLNLCPRRRRVQLIGACVSESLPPRRVWLLPEGWRRGFPTFARAANFAAPARNAFWLRAFCRAAGRAAGWR